MRARNAALALIFAALSVPCAHAATTVNCTASAGGIAFGIYNPLSAVANASTGTLRVTCNGSGTGSANVTVNVSLSTGLSGSYATRKMATHKIAEDVVVPRSRISAPIEPVAWS